MLHYIWDFTGIPAVMIALTSRDAKLSIDWNKFQMGSAESIKFSENPSYVTSAVIKKIYEFDDVNGTGVLEPNRTKDIISYDTIKYKWLRTGFIHDEDYVEVIVSGSHDKHNGTFILKVSYSIKKYEYCYKLLKLVVQLLLFERPRKNTSSPVAHF